MEDTFITILSVITACYALAFVTIFMSGVVPQKWQNAQGLHIAALSMPLAFFAVSLLAAMPGLIILLIIIAATTKG